MVPKTLYTVLLVLAMAGAAPVRAADVVDRIVATVNGHPILQSDWDEAVAYEALANGRSLASVTLEQRKAALDRLIDQELIKEQIAHSTFQPASTTDIGRRVEEIRKNYAEARDDEGFRTVLRAYGLTESELRERVSVELNDMRAVDAHLRPNIQVDAQTVEVYYHEKLLPELRKNGAPEIPFDQVAPRIRELLAQQRMNDLLVNWIRTLRAESNIQRPALPVARAGGGGR